MNQINECLDIVHAFRSVQRKGGRLSVFIIGWENPAVPSHQSVTSRWNGSTNYLNNYGNWSQITAIFFSKWKMNSITQSLGLTRGFKITNKFATEISLIQLMDDLLTLQTNKRLKTNKLTAQKCVSLNFTIWVPWYERFLQAAIITPVQASAALMTQIWVYWTADQHFTVKNMASWHK